MTLDRRRFLAIAGTLPALAAQATFAETPANGDASAWRIQRLSWAGVRIEGASSSLFVDPWVSTAIWDGAWSGPVVPLEASSPRRAVLLTHLHNDHFDAAAVKQILGDTGIVIAVDSMVATVASRGFRVRSIPLYQPEPWGDFIVIAVPASDGFGDEQVSWIVVGNGRRLFHGGDTEWHGRFERLGPAYGPFDVAFLPANGAIVGEGAAATGEPRTLTPRQAAVAARLLGARSLVPIHYGISDATYREHTNALEELRSASAGAPFTLRIVEQGSWL